MGGGPVLAHFLRPVERVDRDRVLFEPGHALDIGTERLQAREERDPELDRAAPEDVLVLEHPLELLLGERERNVEQEVDLAAVERLQHVRVAVGFADLVEDLDVRGCPGRAGTRPYPRSRRCGGRARAGVGPTGRSSSLRRGPPTERNGRAPTGDEPDPGRDQRLDEGVREGRAEAGDLARGLHLDPEKRVGAGELEERELGDLDPPAARAGAGRRPSRETGGRASRAPPRAGAAPRSPS